MNFNKITLNLAAFVFMLFTISCKKEKIDPVDEKEVQTSYYVKFKADGVQKVFKEDAISLIFSGEGSDKVMQYNAILNGNEIERDTTKNGLTIFMAHSNEIRTGETYVNFSSNKSSIEKAKLIWFIYKDEKGTDYYSFGDEISNFYGINSDGQIRFSEIKPNYTKGAFSATVYNDGYTKNKKITDGEFYLKREIVAN